MNPVQPSSIEGASRVAVPDKIRQTSTSPKVWLLLGDRTGDRNQVLNLAKALGWPCEVKNLKYRYPYYRFPTTYLGASLLSLDSVASDPLRPPWPDLIISIGRRSVPVMRWIQKQAGGSTKLVALGRPRAVLDVFDLVVTTPQYRLPERPNVFHIPLPLHPAKPEELAEAAEFWAARFAHLPRPHFALLVGGSSAPYVFDVAAARNLGQLASERARESRGSLLVSTSFRTDATSREALFRAIEAPSYLYAWKAEDLRNPYLGFLADADAFFVTSESASMLAEAVSMDKPVQIYQLPKRENRKTCLKNWCYQQAILRRPYQWLIDIGLTSLPRDPDRIVKMLLGTGLATTIDAPSRQPARCLSDNLDDVVAKIRALMGDPPDMHDEYFAERNPCPSR